MNLINQPVNLVSYLIVFGFWVLTVNFFLSSAFRRSPIIGRINLIYVIPLLAVGIGSFLAGYMGMPLWFMLLLMVVFGYLMYLLPLVVLIRRTVVKNLHQLVDISRKIKDGYVDVAHIIEINSPDETGEIAQNLNSCMRQMGEFVDTLRKTISSGKDLGNELSSSAEEMNATLIEMERTLESLQATMTKLDEMQKRARSSVEEIKVEIQNTNKAIEEQSQWIQQSSTSVEQMAANISSITNVTKDKRGLSDQLAEVAKEGEKDLNETLTSMEGISQAANVIFDMIKIINQVAAQTNLLAMNAAIEAAHAGEAGRGFAVVADEIRKLAVTTGANAKNISQNLKSIIRQISDTSKVTKNTAQRITAIFEGIREVSDSMRETLMGLQEIDEGSRQIVQTFINLNRISSQVKTFSQNVYQKTVQSAAASDQVSQLTEEANHGIAEILVGVREVRNAAGNLAALSDKNTENIQVLQNLTTRFTTE